MGSRPNALSSLTFPPHAFALKSNKALRLLIPPHSKASLSVLLILSMGSRGGWVGEMYLQSFTDPFHPRTSGRLLWRGMKN